MNAPTIQTQGETRKAHQESSELKEGTEMKAGIGKAKVGISEALGHSVGSKFLRVVALGGLLVGAAVLYSSMSQGEAGSRPASSAAIQDIEVEELEAPVIGIAAYGSSEDTQALPDMAYSGSQDPEVAERVFDEVRAAFFGTGSPSSATTQAFQAPAYWVHKAEAEERLLDEVRQAFIGIPSSSSEVTQAVEVEELETPVIGVPAPTSSETTQAFQVQTYWAQKYEAEEMLLDELRDAIFGEPRPVTG
jgi:hypothetical protein